MADSDDTEREKQKELFSVLILTDAWKELERIGVAQIEGHLAHLLEGPNVNLDGVAQAMSSEYRKGAIFGIKVILGTPRGTIILAEANVQMREKPHGNSPVSSSVKRARRHSGNDDDIDDDNAGTVTDLS